MASTDELLKLDVATRLKLIEQLQDSVLRDLNDPAHPHSLPISDELRALLDERVAAYRAAPARSAPWSEVRARILTRR